jgi:predicted amidohydrolase
MMTKVGLTLAQITCQLHNKAENLRRMQDIVRNAKGDIVVFPELSLTGYMPRDDLFKQAEEVSGPSISGLLALAEETGKDVIFGAPVRDDAIRGVVYNSSLLASGDGKLFRYDKMYLPTFGPFEERIYFAGGGGAVVARGAHARVGLMVCYDAFFPELSKLETMMGAQLLVDISASPTTSRPNFEKVMPARAVENGVFFAYANLVGVHGGLVFNGGSTLYDPWGEVVAHAPNLHEAVVDSVIDLADIDIARRFRPLLRDTRPELLDEIGSLLRRGSK